LVTRVADNHQVAIKRMKDSFENWQAVKALSEVVAIRSIPRHPNIVDAHEVVKGTQGRLYLVFEYMPNGSLFTLLDRSIMYECPLTETTIRSLTRQILSAVGHCHDHGFFHRDLKPENILLKRRPPATTSSSISVGGREEEWICKLTDFSLVRRIQNHSKNHHLPPTDPPTSYISTRWYRAPEILLKCPRYSSPVDMYAIGCILSELYELDPLFPGDSELDQVYRVFGFLGKPTGEKWVEGWALASKLGIDLSPTAVQKALVRNKRVLTLQEICDARIVTRGQHQQRQQAETACINKIERLSGMLQNDSLVSEHVFDLFCGLIDMDPKKRLNALDALKHPYFVSRQENTKQPTPVVVNPYASTGLPKTGGGGASVHTVSPESAAAQVGEPETPIFNSYSGYPVATLTLPAYRTPKTSASPTYDDEDMDLFCS